jgi:hypothetical protein
VLVRATAFFLAAAGAAVVSSKKLLAASAEAVLGVVNSSHEPLDEVEETMEDERSGWS